MNSQVEFLPESALDPRKGSIMLLHMSANHRLNDLEIDTVSFKQAISSRPILLGAVDGFDCPADGMASHIQQNADH